MKKSEETRKDYYVKTNRMNNELKKSGHLMTNV